MTRDFFPEYPLEYPPHINLNIQINIFMLVSYFFIEQNVI